MENNKIKEKNINEKVKKKNKKKIIIAIIAIIVIIAFVLITLIINNVIKDKSEIEGEETSNLAEADLDLTHMGITEYPTNWSEDVTIYEDKSLEDEDGNIITYYVPIPDGYVISEVNTENNVKDGLVIYEGTEEVNDDNVETAKKTRNQWVWVPINPENVYYEDSNDTKYSIYHTWSSSATDIDEGLTSDTSKTTEPWIWASSYYYYENEYLDTYYSEEDSIAEIYNEMRQNYEEMIASIEKYGGFYIGRYELGDNETTSARSTEYDTSSTPVVMQERYPYNYINWYQAYDLCSNLGANDTVKTNLIYGTLWDNTLMALYDMGALTYEDIAVDSSGWGNYNGVSFTYTKMDGTTATKGTGSTLIPTGSADHCKISNIYDLSGNVREWTIEALTSSSNSRYYRGGNYIYNGSFYPASNRGSTYPNSNNVGYGCRPILYIR